MSSESTRSSTLTVTVKLFAAYQDVYQMSELQLQVPQGTTVQQIGDRLRAPYPQLQRLTELTRYGLNLEFVAPETPVQAGDEVVLIPPVSGG